MTQILSALSTSQRKLPLSTIEDDASWQSFRFLLEVAKVAGSHRRDGFAKGSGLLEVEVFDQAMSQQ